MVHSKKKSFLLISSFILCVFSIIMLISLYATPAATKENDAGKLSWKKQLHEMNYLIMRTSSANIINGLMLKPEQMNKLKRLEKKIRSLSPAIPDMKGNASADLVKIRKAYLELIPYLDAQKSIPKKLENKIIGMRLLESEIIKRSVLGSRKPGYQGSGCLECHAPPGNFPKGDISGVSMKVITEEERYSIDKAHAVGLLGQKGMAKLWEVKSDVDRTLSSGQRYMLKFFKCCLVPPKDLANPANIGQAFVTSQWINYFNDVRNVPAEDWENIKYLYIVPIEDFLEAALPGIRPRDKKRILKEVSKLLDEARAMDKIDYALQKKEVCLKLKEALRVDNLRYEKKLEKEVRQFRTALFLLLPGNSDIYNKLLRRNSP
ncbi:MAG: hypothetical protein GY754_26005 [bacterium]|nr:hypothetical protein [bacterium]